MYLYFFFLAHDVFVLFELSMIGGDTVICLFLFPFSYCATLIIVLYL